MELDQTNTLKAIGLMQTFINTHPNSTRLKQANAIIDNLRDKLESKDYKSAELYYNMGHYRAAAIAYTSLINGFPDTKKGDQYKLQAIKSYYLYAQNSVEEKKAARYEQVVTEVNDFNDRYPESELRKDAEHYATLSQNNIKQIIEETFGMLHEDQINFLSIFYQCWLLHKLRLDSAFQIYINFITHILIARYNLWLNYLSMFLLYFQTKRLINIHTINQNENYVSNKIS